VDNNNNPFSLKFWIDIDNQAKILLRTLAGVSRRIKKTYKKLHYEVLFIVGDE